MKNTSLTKGKRTTLICLLVVSLFACGKKDKSEIPTGNVQRGTFYIDMYEEGEIEAIQSINISSPSIPWRYGNLKITQLVKDGQEVNAGDTLIVFDPSEVQKGIIEAESRLEISRAELEKMKAQQGSELEELKADYEVTRISQEISRIKFESAAYESDITKKEIQLNLEKADISLEQAREQIENKIKIHREEIRQKQLSIEQDQARLTEAHETMKKLFVVTPAPGIAIISHNWSSNAKFQIGDQCWAGFPLIQLPDLSSLKATVKINEVDIAKITKGMKVEIKPDAFSESTFTGKVQSVANLAVNKEGSNKIKVFPVEILINETDKNLLPGLTVSCRMIIDKVEDALSIPLVALHLEGDKYFVYKKKGNGFDKVYVETGPSNTDYITITKGLNEKDRVALIDPFGEENKEKTSTGE